MGTRSEVETVEHPYPVVYDAFLRCLPTVGFRITGTDPDRGRIGLATRNTTFELAVGAVDATTTEWVATAELKLGMFRDRHEEHFRRMRESLGLYLVTYYA